MDDLLAIMQVLERPDAHPPLVPPEPPPRRGGSDKQKAAAAGDVSPAQEEQANPCHSVTLEAVLQIAAAIDKALTEARQDEALNGEDGGYPVAPRYSVSHLTLAKERTDRLASWLASFGSQFFDKDGFMINTSATYSVYNNMRDIGLQVHLGRHWSAVSCAYNSPRADPPRENEHAVACIDFASVALGLSEPLAANATRCYIRGFCKVDTASGWVSSQRS